MLVGWRIYNRSIKLIVLCRGWISTSMQITIFFKIQVQARSGLTDPGTMCMRCTRCWRCPHLVCPALVCLVLCQNLYAVLGNTRVQSRSKEFINLEICILKLTSLHNQTSLTTQKRSASRMVPPHSGRKGTKSPFCPPSSSRQDCDWDTLQGWSRPYLWVVYDMKIWKTCEEKGCFESSGEMRHWKSRSPDRRRIYKENIILCVMLLNLLSDII